MRRFTFVIAVLFAFTMFTSSALAVQYIAPSNNANQSMGTSNLLFLDNTNGRVGVGTASPATKLQISAGDITLDANQKLYLNAGTNTAYITRATTGTAHTLIYSDGNAPLDIGNGGLAIGSYANVNTVPANSVIVSGSVGIGDATPTNKLDVAGAIGISDTTIIDASRNIVNAGTGTFSGAVTTPSVYMTPNSNSPYASSSWVRAAASSGVFLTNNGISSWAGIRSDDAFEVSGNSYLMGNVGVGTRTPATKLDVVGNGNFSGTVTVNSEVAVPSVAGQGRIGGEATNGLRLIGYGSTYDVSLLNRGGSNAMGILANTVNAYFNGNVGIGASPTQKLTLSGGQILVGVDGTSSDASLYLRGGSAGNKARITLNHYGTADYTIAVGDTAGKLSLTKTQGGVDGIIIDSSGNVGVGTASPATILEVQKGTDVAGDPQGIRIARYAPSQYATTYPVLDFYSATNHFTGRIASTFYNGGSWTNAGLQLSTPNSAGTMTARMTITNDGNVGIGTANPTTALDVTQSSTSGVTTTIRNTNGGANAWAGLRMGNDVAVNRLEMWTIPSSYVDSGLYHADGSLLTNEGAGGLTIGAVHASGILRLATGGTGSSNERMTILANGNIGVGTTAPEYGLHLGSNAAPKNLAFTIDNPTQAGIIWKYIGQTKVNAKISSVGSGSYANKGLAFYTTDTADTTTDAVERMRITESGNVGIGMTPNVKLEVKGSEVRFTDSTGVGIIGFTPSTTLNSIHSDYYSGGDIPLVLGSYANRANQLYLATSGNVGMRETSPTAPLEIRDATWAAGSTRPTVLKLDSYTDNVNEGPFLDFTSRWGGVYQDWVVGRIGGVYDSTVGNGGALVFYTNYGVGATSATVSEQMRIGPTGLVGVGSSSPSARLTVASGIDGRWQHWRYSDSYAPVELGGVTYTGTGVWSTSNWFGSNLNTASGSTPTQFNTGGSSWYTRFGNNPDSYTINRIPAGGAASALVSIDSSGNMGVSGTVTASSFSGSGAGLSSGTVPIASLVAGDYSSKVTSGTYSISITGSAGSSTTATTATNIAGGGAGYIPFQSGAGATAFDGTNFFWDNTNKRLGVGTNGPQSGLDVLSSTTMTGGWTRNMLLKSTFPVLVFHSTYATPASTFAGIGYDSSTAAMAFWTNAATIDVSAATPAMYLRGTNLGVGTTNPGAKLEVTGSTAPGIFVSSTNYPTTYHTQLGVQPTAQGVLVLGNNGLNEIRFGTSVAGGYGNIYVNNLADYSAAASGTLAMTFKANGNILIAQNTLEDSGGTARIQFSSGNIIATVG